MKKLLLLFTLFTGIALNSQYVEQEVIVEDKLTVGTSDLPTGNSVFEVGDTLGGVKFPRFTQTQIDNLSLSNADTALMLYNLTDSVYQFYDGDTWGNMQGGATLYSSNGTLSGARTVDHDGNTLTFSNGKVKFSSTDNGFVPNKGTTAQMDAISTPETDELFLNTDENGLYRYDGANWVALAKGYGIVGVNDANGQPTYYATLAAAVSAISGDGVVHLYSNITIDDASEEAQVGTGDELTINGNGYTITHTCNTGDNFSVIYGNGDALYLNNVKIVSNGTASGTYTATVIGRSSLTVSNVYCSSDTYIYALNNNIKDLGAIYGGRLEAVNGYASFAGKIYNSVVTTKFTRGNLYNSDITINTGGSISKTSTDEIMNCHITGDATTSSFITIDRGIKFWGNTVICTGGSNFALGISSGTAGDFINIKDCHIEHQGTGIAVNAVYFSSIKDTYIYSEGNEALYVQNTSDSYSGINLENVTLVNNATNEPTFNYAGILDGFKVINLKCISKNATNTQPAIDLDVDSGDTLTIIDSYLEVANNSINHVEGSGTGTAYIFGLKMSGTGTGLNLGTVTLGNTTGTIDEYGNGQIE